MQPNRSNAGTLIGGAVLIAFGLLSLAGQIFRNVNWVGLWPLLVIGLGALFFVAMFAGGANRLLVLPSPAVLSVASD